MKNEIIVFTYSNINAFLVSGQGGSILIDTGTEKHKDSIHNACRNKHVKLILLTHGHFDHCQNAAYFADAFQCPVGIGAQDVELLEQGIWKKVHGKGVWGTIYASAANYNITHKDINCMKPDVILKPGMSLEEYGVNGSVIALPGHTKGSVGVLLASGEFFVGDAMQSIGKPACTWCYEDYESAVLSVRRIQELNASRIYYGHGKDTGHV